MNVFHSRIYYSKVGITNELFFGQGYGIRGFFYGGSLSDGRDVVRGYFGPSLKTGDNLYMKLNIAHEQIEGESKTTQRVTLVLNDKMIGIAYKIEINREWWSWEDNDENAKKKLRPTVLLRSPGDKVCFQQISQTDFNAHPTHHTADDITGDWEHSDTDPKMSVKIEQDSEDKTLYHVNLHAGGNILFGGIAKRNNKWESGAFASTRVGVPQEVLGKFRIKFAHAIVILSFRS